MHRKSFPRSARLCCQLTLGSLLLFLGLHFQASRAAAQPPGEQDKDIIRVHLDEARLIQMKGGQAPTSLKNETPKFFTVEPLKDNPAVIKIVPLSPGRGYLLMSDGKVTEIREVIVMDTAEELFQVQRRQMEKRREILLQLIRQVVPTANVDVILGLQRSKVAVGISALGAPAASGPNDNTVLTGTVILTGIVFETEKVHIIVDLANAVFAGTAQPSAPPGAAQAPGGTQQTGTGATTPAQPSMPGPTGTVIGTQGQNIGNRITVINSLRIAGVHQVELGVVMAVVNRTEARSMGFNWFNNANTWFLTSLVNPAVGVATSFTSAATAGVLGNGFSTLANGAGQAISSPPQLGFGVLNPNNGFAGFLQALRAENLVKILAEPRLLTLSGRPANFVDGGMIPVITSSAGGGSTASYLQFGTVINFVPIVLGNGKIHLEVAASISSPNSSVGVSVATAGSLASAPGLTSRGAQVAVQLEDGQTLAIGGLIQNNISGSTAKIPILGDLPYFGAAFRSVTYSEQEEELIILVTPRLVDPMACSQLKPYPGRETRSPDDYELFLEGILEAPRGRRAPCETGHFVAAHKVPGANDPPFPCGDSPRPAHGYFTGGMGCNSCSGMGCNSGNGTSCSSCGNGSCAVPTISSASPLSSSDGRFGPPTDSRAVTVVPNNGFAPTAPANGSPPSAPQPFPPVNPPSINPPITPVTPPPSGAPSANPPSMAPVVPPPSGAVPPTPEAFSPPPPGSPVTFGSARSFSAPPGQYDQR